MGRTGKGLTQSELDREGWKERAFGRDLTPEVNFIVRLFNRPLTSRFINKILINKFQGYSSYFPGELFSFYLVPETSYPLKLTAADAFKSSVFIASETTVGRVAGDSVLPNNAHSF